MIEVFVHGDPKPKPAAASYVQWRSAEFAKALAGIRRGAMGKTAQALLARALFVKHYNPRGAEEWRRSVRAALASYRSSSFGAGAALSVSLSFAVRRPQAHYRTGKYAGKLKDWALRAFPTTRATGDVDNLAKSTLDELSGCVLHDDSEIVDLYVGKRYVMDGPTGCMIVVRRAEPVEVPMEAA